MRCGRGLLCLASAALFAGTPVRAQTSGDVFSADSAQAIIRTPLLYDTSYDRDRSTGTWAQSLSYNYARQRLSLSANGNYTSIDLILNQGSGSESGNLTTRGSFLVTRRWNLALEGTFTHLGSRDPQIRANDRQNRLRLSNQLNLVSSPTLSLQSTLYGEIEQDHGLTSGPAFRTRTIAADTVRTDAKRDSVYTRGPQEGITMGARWTIAPWMKMSADFSGTRTQRKISSYLHEFGTRQDGVRVEVPDTQHFNPMDGTQSAQSQWVYSGKRGLLASLNMKYLDSDQSYYEKDLRNIEQLGINQRSALGHFEYPPIRGAQLTIDGKKDYALSQYSTRGTRTSRVTGQSAHSSLFYGPSVKGNAGAEFTVDQRKTDLQTIGGNGVTITRFLQLTGMYRLTRRLGVQGSGSASLNSIQFVPAEAKADQDYARAALNVAGTYTISKQCSTTVRFLVTRGHLVWIDPSRSGTNSALTNYQVDAGLKLGVTPTLSINQNYSFVASYTIYDQLPSESKNVLNRSKRIDTTVTETFFSVATFQLTHNFLFLDSGSFQRRSASEARLYNVLNERWQQALSATLTAKPARGIQIYISQNLNNTRIHQPASDLRTRDNQWQLVSGASVDRTILGSASLHGSFQRIQQYTERQSPADDLRESDVWVAGVALHKEF